ncbi:hypothetical protein BDV97DRAFT_358898 [Delphinella strobiligena]|nr:hypothetical protein BDV97DRAFT_358898 [Delphinella strobiligena]
MSDSSRSDRNETHVHADLERADAISPPRASHADTAGFEHVSQALSQSLSQLTIKEQGTTGFFSLPPEVRNKIYILALEDYVATWKTPEDFWLHDPIQQPPITHINCHTRSECLPIFFELVQPKGPIRVALNKASAGTSAVHPDNMHWLRKATGDYEMDRISLAITMLAPIEKGIDSIPTVVHFNASIIRGHVECSAVFPHLERCPRRDDPCWKTGTNMAYKIEGILEGAMRSRCPVDEAGAAGMTLADIEQVRLFCEGREDVFDVPAWL